MGEELKALVQGVCCPRAHGCELNDAAECPAQRVADAIASRDAEIERLRGEVAEARDQDRWIIRMAEIREASGVGHKPMLDEVSAAIKAKIATKDAALGEAEDAITDARAGWRYTREHHGDLYGVGWDRVETKLTAALSTIQAAREPS